MTTIDQVHRADGGCERGYRATSCLWGVDPEPLVLALADYRAVSGAAVLDAGCGEGRNAAHIARLGARVTALDVSQLAIDHARTTWPDEPGITWHLADILNWPMPPDGYEVVLCDSVLHWLTGPAEVAATVRRLQDATRPGGLHVICSFNTRLMDYSHHVTPPRCLLPDADLIALYNGWSILEHHDEDIVSSHVDVPDPHHHSVTKFIARRPLLAEDRR
jgi:2-polyprenyl-3-methyl-5-hydroxy-6-metoxy-1,4-benzoquinol methylase